MNVFHRRGNSISGCTLQHCLGHYMNLHIFHKSTYIFLYAKWEKLYLYYTTYVYYIFRYINTTINLGPRRHNSEHRLASFGCTSDRWLWDSTPHPSGLLINRCVVKIIVKKITTITFCFPTTYTKVRTPVRRERVLILFQWYRMHYWDCDGKLFFLHRSVRPVSSDSNL